MHTELMAPQVNTARSGYSAHVNPSRMEPAELKGQVVPIASDKGAQEGRLRPADFRPTANYEKVTAEEAMIRASKRSRGELPPIAGGIDAPSIRPPQAQDIDSDASVEASMDASDARVEEPRERRSVVAEPRRRKRLGFTTDVGTYTISVDDVVCSDTGVIVLTSGDDDSATFVPAPGSHMTLNFENRGYKCYYPGLKFDLKSVNSVALVFIMSTEASDDN